MCVSSIRLIIPDAYSTAATACAVAMPSRLLTERKPSVSPFTLIGVATELVL